MEILEKLYLVLMVVIMILALSYVTSLIIEYAFLRKNYKKVLERGYIITYESFYSEYIFISKYLDLAIGSFEIIDFEKNIRIIKNKNNYFSFDGSNLTFLFSSIECVEDKLVSCIEKIKKTNEKNSI